MAEAPKTSITLLKAIAKDAASVRWAEFCNVYDAPMHAFLAARFPTVDADDAIQDTLVTLLRVLPDYTYLPDERGHFRNYLLGILKYRALDILRRRARDERLVQDLQAQTDESAAVQPESSADDAEEQAWREAAFESALAQLLANKKIDEHVRQIFRRVALCHESPEAVAAAFGTTRNNVDQIKSRMVRKLSELIEAMVRAREAGGPAR